MEEEPVEVPPTPAQRAINAILAYASPLAYTLFTVLYYHQYESPCYHRILLANNALLYLAVYFLRDISNGKIPATAGFEVSIQIWIIKYLNTSDTQNNAETCYFPTDQKIFVALSFSLFNTFLFFSNALLIWNSAYVLHSIFTGIRNIMNPNIDPTSLMNERNTGLLDEELALIPTRRYKPEANNEIEMVSPPVTAIDPTVAISPPPELDERAVSKSFADEEFKDAVEPIENAANQDENIFHDARNGDENSPLHINRHDNVGQQGQGAAGPVNTAGNPYQPLEEEGHVCAICIVCFVDSDIVAELPGCGHVLHYNCVKVWLNLHALCPICRNNIREALFQNSPVNVAPGDQPPVPFEGSDPQVPRIPRVHSAAGPLPNNDLEGDNVALDNPENIFLNERTAAIQSHRNERESGQQPRNSPSNNRGSYAPLIDEPDA